ncbi:MAG: hypothetical protein LBC80_00945 [Treponema sp.]|jgi:hypothetical protein|nr:hypothetical protein [Treponema sp.]
MSVEQIKPHRNKKVRTGFRFRDFFIIVLCLYGIYFCFNLFRLDILQTIYLQNVQPVGTVTVKYNTVQRRISDRVLWDRLHNESPVYLGDIIRVADLSSASLDIEGQQINLNENTLIRIQRAPDGRGLQIDLAEGSLDVTTNEIGGIIHFSMGGQIVEATADSTLNVSALNNHIVIQVNEGTARIVNESGENTEVNSGFMVSMDTDGTELHRISAVMSQPLPNARFLKNTQELLPVSFVWNRINLEQNDFLNLEIAADRNFNRIIQTAGNVNDSAQISLDSGTWYWRLTFGNEELSFGRFTIVEASGPELLFPIRDSTFLYQNELPSIRFNWSEVAEASFYFLQVSLLPDFVNIQINIETTATSYIQPVIGQGTWYWRVMPVFSSTYDGYSSFSQISQFRIEQNTDTTSEQTILTEDENIVMLEPLPPPPPPPEPLEIHLLAPEQGVNLSGLTAIRSPTIFLWESDREAARARFVLSRNSNPLSQPAIEITNPGRIVQINRIEPGIWYWTIEAWSYENLVSAAPPRQFQVLSIPLLSAPVNRLPINGTRINIESLRTRRNIDFSWQAVPGANAYVFTLFEQTAAGRRQISQNPPENRTSFRLENLAILSSGTFVWQVEAVNIGPNGSIDQRGSLGANSFIIDIPLPEVEAIRPGVLYGR